MRGEARQEIPRNSLWSDKQKHESNYRTIPVSKVQLL